VITPRRVRGLRHGIAFLAILMSIACAGSVATPWAESISQSDRARVFENLSEEARGSLISLSEIFYERVSSRRFNSRATFEDPSMRQFFPTVAAYSDYYAALVDALDQANIRVNRPTEIELLGIDVDPSGSLRLSLRFIGRNDLPLRWWNAVMLRTDEWRWLDGRWWVVPGKV